MAVTHISEAEAARDLPSILRRVRDGEHVVIEKERDAFMIVPLHATVMEQPRLLSDVLSDLKRDASDARLDEGFGKDVEDGIRSHQHERLIDPWESF